MVDGSWRLDGTKLWCSGGHLLDSALVTAHAGDGHRLFFIELDAPGIDVRSTWTAVAVDVDFDGVKVDISAAVGGPGWYLDRRGFWMGGIGWRRAGTAARSGRCDRCGLRWRGATTTTTG